MSDNPLVTIGIPTYNRAGGMLAQTVRAALAQTYPDFEVIVSDNCSTDGTPELMQSMADPRLRYCRNERNLGANGNFNALLERARGEFFLLLHDDDLIEPEFLSACMAVANEPDVGFVKTGIQIIGPEGETIRVTKNEFTGTSAEDFYRAWFTGMTSVYLSGMLYRTALLRESGGFHSRYFLLEDGMAIARILGTHSFRSVPAPLARFREHSDQKTHTASLMQWAEEFGGMLVFLARQPSPISRECLELGRGFFHRLMRKWAKQVSNPVARRFSRWRIDRYFRRLELS